MAKTNTNVSERRAHPRLARSFQGTWAGAGQCRISDVSISGCFVNTLASPGQGEETEVAVAIGDHRFTLRGEVAYVDDGMGFALKFGEIGKEDRQVLLRLLKALASEDETI